MVVSTLMDSTSWAVPYSSWMMGVTTREDTRGNSRHSPRVAAAWMYMDRYWSGWVASVTFTLVWCKDTSLHSHLVQ